MQKPGLMVPSFDVLQTALRGTKGNLSTYLQDFPVAQTVKKLPAMQETRVRSLSWEVPLEKGMAIHCSVLAWRSPRTEKPGRLQFVVFQRVGHDWVTDTHTHTTEWLAHTHTHTTSSFITFVACVRTFFLLKLRLRTITLYGGTTFCEFVLISTVRLLWT